uniref:Uncharacterized protein n=1 Tax=Anguilla anguilla TaxID=7936 RepID=A0A0E9SK48_ANGAN
MLLRTTYFLNTGLKIRPQKPQKTKASQ